MPKRSSKSDDPIVSAKRVLDHVIAKHDPDAPAKTSVSGKNPRWRLWDRHWDASQGDWDEWKPTDTVFGDDEYSDYERWVSTDYREFQIRPENDSEADRDEPTDSGR